MATPVELRKALRKSGLPYDIIKTDGSWYVCGGNSHQWKSTCLFASSLSGLSANQWIKEIRDLANEETLRTRFVLETTFTTETKKLATEMELENSKLWVIFAESLITDKNHGLIVLECSWENKTSVLAYIKQKSPDIIAIRENNTTQK
jgi:hypothetical protein